MYLRHLNLCIKRPARQIAVFVLCFFCCTTALHSQVFLNFSYPIIDSRTAFMEADYDVDLMKKNKVESFQQENVAAFFDTSGRIEKFVLHAYDSSVQTTLFYYNAGGECISTKTTDTKLQEPLVNSFVKQYDNGLLIKDSSLSGFICKHMEYYQNGVLRQEIWFGQNHRIQKGFWFGLDSSGRLNRIIERTYMNSTKPNGYLSSDRTLFYNQKGQMTKEVERQKNVDKAAKALFCPNGGSATFVYDSANRLTNINRTAGPSQTITYLENGLIGAIETIGKNCEGDPYHWRHRYSYTYRN